MSVAFVVSLVPVRSLVCGLLVSPAAGEAEEAGLMVVTVTLLLTVCVVIAD